MNIGMKMESSLVLLGPTADQLPSLLRMITTPSFCIICSATPSSAGMQVVLPQPLVTQGNLKQVEVQVPSNSIQRRIAAILSAYDDLIENSQRLIKILEEMARWLYREWFVHYRFPGHEDCRLVDSPLGEIPEG